MAEANIENVLKNELTITHNNESYIFRIPSIKDRLTIAAVAAKLRKDNDPEGNGLALGYDPTALMLSDRIATFMVLLSSSTAKWIYSPSSTGPTMKMENWPDDVPVMEVVDQFNIELEEFRKKGNRPQE